MRNTQPRKGATMYTITLIGYGEEVDVDLVFETYDDAASYAAIHFWDYEAVIEQIR